MEARKVLLVDDPHPYLQETLAQHGFVFTRGSEWPREKIIEEISSYFGLVIKSRIKLDQALLSHATNLKFIARVGAGIESIDVEYAASMGIQTITSPEGNRDAVGEHAMGMLLSLTNHLNRSDKQVREGQWLREHNRGIEVKGRTVGIIGYGNMGRAFAQRLLGFEAKVIAYDKYLHDFSDEYAQEVGLETLFRETDILSLHVPLTDETHYMVDDAFLNQFAKPIILINTARGKSVNTADLVVHMKAGRVIGAALDVLEYESISFDDLNPSQFPAPFQYLRQQENVILSPHVAGWTVESKFKHANVLVERIIAAFC